jgi:hypothetical protein
VHAERRLSTRAMVVQLNLDKQLIGPELWPKIWILHHDNDPTHKALSVKHFLPQKSITKTEYPTCSPDLAPSDCFLFPKINSTLKGPRF